MAQRCYSGIPFWIDALCIDQENHIERNHQVERMGRIYSAAERVYAWLGTDTYFDPFFDYALSFGPSRALLHDEEAPAYRERVRKLASHHYWRRTWIIQEITLAQELVVLNGPKSLEWGSLMRALVSVRGDWLSIFGLMKMRHEAREVYSMEIWKPLAEMANSACVDTRDRIYGMLSMVIGGGSFAVKYEEDVFSLFWRAGEHFGAWADGYRMSWLCKALGVNHSTLRADIATRRSRKLPLPIITGMIHNVYLSKVDPKNKIYDDDFALVIHLDSADGSCQYRTHNDRMYCPDADRSRAYPKGKSCTFSCDIVTVHDVLISLKPSSQGQHSHVRLSPRRDGYFATFWCPLQWSYVVTGLELDASTVSTILAENRPDSSPRGKMAIPIEFILIYLKLFSQKLR
jgi:hypothetical protein